MTLGDTITFAVAILIAILITFFATRDIEHNGLRETIFQSPEEKRLREEYELVENYDHSNSVLDVNVAKMGFDRFEKLYWVAPDEWEVLSDEAYRVIQPSDSWKHTVIHVHMQNFEDFVKYREFYNHLEELKEQKRQAERDKRSAELLQMLADQAQIDIDRLRKESEREIEEARRTTEAVKKNMEGRVK